MSKPMIYILALSASAIAPALAFQIPSTTLAIGNAQAGASPSRSRLNYAVPQANTQLTDRQLQFWEDVGDGLTDVENAFGGPGSIDRIRTFCKRAKGELPLPVPTETGHQPSEEHVDGLTAKAFWEALDDPKSFPWAAELEEKSDIILKEFETNMLETAKADAAAAAAAKGGLFEGDSAWQNKVMGTGWSAFRLQRLGVWNVENCARFPQTYELLRSLQIPLAVRGVCFARQAPGSGVAPHTDGRNFILTSHLGLKIPEKVWMKAGDEKRGWTEGKLTTLDTSFEHSTGNPTDEDRHVLIIDYWHPELTDAERAGLELVYDLRNEFESGNVPFRKPKRNPDGYNFDENEEEEEGQGLAGLWKSLTGGGD